MTLTDVIIVGIVLVGLFVLAYCKIKNKTLLEVIVEIREAFQDKTEEEIE